MVRNEQCGFCTFFVQIQQNHHFKVQSHAAAMCVCACLSFGIFVSIFLASRFFSRRNENGWRNAQGNVFEFLWLMNMAHSFRAIIVIIQWLTFSLCIGLYLSFAIETILKCFMPICAHRILLAGFNSCCCCFLLTASVGWIGVLNAHVGCACVCHSSI